MSYIEKEKLIKADIASIENRVRHAFNQGYDLGFKDGRSKQPNCSEIPTGSTTKNDLGVDCISMIEVLRLLVNSIGKTNTYLQTEVLKMPSVTPQESIKKLEEQIKQLQNRCYALTHGQMCVFCPYECEYKTEIEPHESEDKE